MIEGWFDGVCEPRNPGGYAAYGALVKIDGKVVWSEGKLVGHGPGMSNNVSEYSGFIAVMKRILEIKPLQACRIRGDSALVVNQLNKRWQVRGGLYVPFFHEAHNLYHPVRQLVRLEWIGRDENSECDHLSKQVLRDLGIEFKIQREKAA